MFKISFKLKYAGRGEEAPVHNDPDLTPNPFLYQQDYTYRHGEWKRFIFSFSTQWEITGQSWENETGLGLPIKWDFFSAFGLQLLNQPFFHNFMGTLDSNGDGAAALVLPPIPGYAGERLRFAYGLYQTVDFWFFVSNPVTINIVP